MSAGRVVVVGAGVIGLTAGVRLAQAGFEVEVLAREMPLETTSAVAAAIWPSNGRVEALPSSNGWPTSPVPGSP
jgi:2-polyprenyl-6-methoxyphenol hydroxylase-like FAD-dependent oxidoreductase